MISGLQTHQTAGSAVHPLNRDGWRLEIPAGPPGTYRWAQLDDYTQLSRSSFPWRFPTRLELRARVSAAELPGTWGFGFWNEPFSASLGISGMARRLPALPNAAWFFYAGIPNHLAFRDSHPAAGFLSATFSSPLLPPLALAPAVLGLPLLAFPPTARLLRRAASLFIQEDAASIQVDVTQWHAYQLDWQDGEVCFLIDQRQIFSTPFSPRGRLGLVIWIDNQYAAFPPSGKLRAGTSPNPESAWLEVDHVAVSGKE